MNMKLNNFDVKKMQYNDSSSFVHCYQHNILLAEVNDCF